MTHFTEEELILHYYGENGRTAGAVEEHLRTCESCRANFQSLGAVLNVMNELPVPERKDAYGREVWQAIEPRIAASGARRWASLSWWFAPRPWAIASAMAALLVLAFLAGRVSNRVTQQAGLSGQVRERIMLVAVGEHLERSQMVLVELENTGAKGPVDISSEQERAEDLINENRLYRQAAMKSGDTAVSSVLDELERVLLEIAHSPSKVDSAELAQIRQRIEADGILFKIRVVGTNLRQREKPRVGNAL